MKNRNWINGTSDIMFKTLLRNNRKYLSFIVSEITKIPEDIIYNNLKYSPVEFTIDNKREKKKISDLIIELDMHLINLEMNKKMNQSIKNRNNLYLDKINVEQYKENEDYKNGKKVIQINFNEKLYDGDKIIYKFKMMEEALNISKGNDMLEEVYKNMEELNMNDVFLGMYDQEEENKKMMNSMKLEGIAEKSIEIAKNMIEKNIEINIISEVTGLSIEEIENLK